VAGLCPDTWGSLQHSPHPSWIKGLGPPGRREVKGEGNGKKRRVGEKKRCGGEGGEAFASVKIKSWVWS